MKPKSFQRQLALFAPLAFTLTLSVQAATVTKAITGTDLTDGASWGGSAPTSTDTATWAGASLGAGLTLNASADWQGIAVTGAASNIDITGSGPLTLGTGGIDLSGSTVDLSMANAVTLGASQSWKAAAGRTLTISGAVTGTGDLASGYAGTAPPATYAGYLSATSGAPTTVFPGTTLANITAVNGIMQGGWLPTATAATGYIFSNNGTTATVQLQILDGTFTKVAKVQLTQVGPDVVAYQVYARYKDSNVLGQDFDVIAFTGSPPTGSGGYGVNSTTAIFGTPATGTVALSGNNSYTGATAVNGGTLVVSGGSAIPDASAVSLSAATILQLNANETIGSLAGAGAGNLQGNTLTAGGNDSSTTYSGLLSGTGGALVKSGTGSLTLAGGNSYTGGTTLSTGTIIATNGGALGTSGAVVINDTSTGSSNTSLLLGNVTISRAITVANEGSGTTTLGADGAVALPTFSGPITLAKDVTLDGGAATDRFTLAGGMGGTGNVTIANTGRVMFLAAANTFSGSLTINSGSTLQLHWSGNTTTDFIPDTSVVTVDGFLKIAKGTGGETIGGLSGNGIVRGHEGVNNVASALTINSAGSDTFSGVLENGGALGSTLSLTKSGVGTQTLSGTNTYSAATTINGGTLSLGTTGSVANSSVITVGSGANFDVSLAGGFTLGGGKTLKGEGTVTGNVSEDASGIGVVTAGNGTSGTLTITGNLAFGTDADVNIGTLSNYTATAAIAVGGDLTASGILGEVVLNLPTATVSPGTYLLISHANGLVNTSGFSLGTQPVLSSRQVGQLVNNAGSLDYVVVGANPVWTGALDSSWTTDGLAEPKNWTLPGGGTTDYEAADIVTFDDTATGTTVNLAMDVAPNSVEFANDTAAYTLQSSGGFGITGATGLLKSGTGILTVTNANLHTGATTLADGITRIGNDSALGAGGLVLNGGTLSSDSATAHAPVNTTVSIGGDLTLGDAVNTGALSFAAPVDLGAATRVLTTESAVSLDGSVANGALSKSGPATLTLTGANTYGATTINAGILKLGDGGATGSAGTGTITNNAALVVDRSGTLTIGGAINGSGSLTVNGGGTVTLTGANIYTGTTTINGSVLVLGMDETYSTSHVGSLVTINSGGTLRLDSYFGTGFAYGFPTSGTAADIMINAGGTFDKNGQATYIRNLTMNGNGAIVGSGANAGDTLQLCGNLTATSTAAGAPSISGVNLVAGTYTDAGNTRTVDVTHGAGSTSTDDLIIGVIGQASPGTAANMIKTGAGTLKLTGANTYAGTTTVNQGTLKGAASLAGTLAVQSGATLAPGDGIGTLAANATTLAGTYVCEVDATTSDVLAVTGALDLTGATLTLSGTPAAASYTIATYTGALTGTFTASPALPSGYTFDYATPGVIKLAGAAGFTSWIDGFGLAVADQDPTDDPDNDGVSNLVEYAVAGRSPAASEGAIGTFTTGTLSFTKRTEAAADSKISYMIQVSDDLGLVDLWTEAPVGPGYINDATTISYTLPTGMPKTFARLVVTQVP